MKRLLFLLMMLSSLALNAQTQNVKIVMRNDAVIIGELKELDALDHVTVIVAGAETTIPMSEVAYIDKIEASKTEKVECVEYEEVQVEDKLADFKGFLLEKGNSVFVYSGNTSSMKAGAEELRRLLKSDGFWVVVDNMNDAHFTINYLQKFKGRDQAILSLSSWRGDGNSIIVLGMNSVFDLEDDEVSKREARQLYYETIPVLQKKIVNRSLSKKTAMKFIIE